MNKTACLLALLALVVAAPGCSLFKPRFVDRGQQAPAFPSDLEDEDLREVIAQRLNSLHTLKCNGVDTTIRAPEETISADLAIFIDPPDRARAIASKGIIGTVADIMAIGNSVSVYVPHEKKVHRIRVRAAEFRSLRTIPWATIWGLRPEGGGPVIGESTRIRKGEGELVVDIPFPLGVGNSERLIFDQDTLLLRSRTIRREGESAAAIIRYMRWYKLGEVWWPLLTSFRVPRADTEITLEFRATKIKVNETVSPAVFKQPIPDDVEVVYETLR